MEPSEVANLTLPSHDYELRRFAAGRRMPDVLTNKAWLLGWWQQPPPSPTPSSSSSSVPSLLTERDALALDASEWPKRWEQQMDVNHLMDAEHLNEVWLYHGTKHAIVDIIATHGFDERVAVSL